jgi:hypothetical protein
MEIRTIIQRGIERRERGLDLQARVDAAVVGEVGAGGQTTYVVSHQSAFATSGDRSGEAERTPTQKVMTTWTASHMEGMRNPTA